MSEDLEASPQTNRAGAPSPKADMREFRLRPEHPQVTRLSRKVLVGAGGVGSVAVLDATIWALQSRHQSGPAPELLSTTHKTQADGLATLPKDYAGIPRTRSCPTAWCNCGGLIAAFSGKAGLVRRPWQAG